MKYCKYCYRILEDGCEICTTCGKSQTAMVRRQRKLLGLIPLYKEKDLEKAKDIFRHSEADYKLAKETSTVLEFKAFWDLLIKNNAILRTYEELVHPDQYEELSTILDVEDEFQWRLRDAVDRSTKNTISDMKGEYRNNLHRRAEMFIDDVNYAIDLADPETAEFILSAINKIADQAKIKLPEQADPVHAKRDSDIFSRYGGIDAELLTVDLMDGHDFEHWCADLLRELGYTNVSVTPGSGDQGVDVLAEKDGLKYAVQCKRYNSDLGNSPVQEVHAGKYIYHAHVAAVMTNQYFTAGAKELATATGVLLWDRDWITNQLKQQKRFFDTPPSTTTVQIDSGHDDMLAQAVDVVLETGQTSVSMIQHRLKLGYARAARIVDEMEEKGFVSPFQGSKPRVIQITQSEWEHLRSQFE